MECINIYCVSHDERVRGNCNHQFFDDEGMADCKKLKTAPVQARKKGNKMACEICKRTSCTRSFHSLSDQEDFDNKTGAYSEEQEQIQHNNLVDSTLKWKQYRNG